MIKAVFVDMDGTLLNNEPRVTEKNARVIKEFQEKGGLFVINTGRDFESASKLVKKSGVSCEYVCLSGACVHEADGTCVKCDCMNIEDIKKIREIEKQHGLYIVYLGAEGSFSATSREDAGACYVNEARILKMDRGEDPDTVTVGQFSEILNRVHYSADIDDLITREVPMYKLAILHRDLDVLQSVKEELKSWGCFNIASSFRTNVEVNSDKVDKGIMAAEYAADKGIQPSEIMVIGDSENDIAMLRYPFGKTVAMGNAEESIKAICTDVTLSNEEDGVAYAIEKWALK